MEPEQPPPVPQPTQEAARITSIDVLRGFAVLGILVMNVQSFSMPIAAYSNPTVYGDLTGANLWTWVITHVFFSQKLITIFSMLFGAGILLMSDRAEASGRATLLHYRRMGWLILFGLLHAHLLWYGDILYAYGMCGLVAYLFRRMQPATLFLWAVVFIGIASAMTLAFGLGIQSAPPEAVAEFQQSWRPPANVIMDEIEAYRGSWLDQLPLRSEQALSLETLSFFTIIGPDVLGRMLLGMALFKLGVFSARRSRGFYATLLAIGLLVGVPISGVGVYLNFAAGWDVRYSLFFGSQFNGWASILVALGWVGAVMLGCQASALDSVSRRLAAVGRLAFTNYILQTLICTWIFYGHGLGLFGRVDRVGQIAIAVAVWAVLLAISPIWLARFYYGPLEWLWRSLTYWRRQPFQRTMAA